MKSFRRFASFSFISIFGMLLITVTCAPVLSSEAMQGQDARLAWWTEARFGLFIHWGLYSAVGCHWHGQNGRSAHMMYYLQIPLAEYAKIADDFNPFEFNADEWVRIAKDAGMKYLVITSKHHEGFAMYNSKVNDYNIVIRTPWKRDPLKELSEACAKAGLKFGVYYSLGRDWEDPDVPTKDQYKENTWDYPDSSKKVFAKYFERKVVPQVRELMTQYHPAILWFDTSGEISRSESKTLLSLIHGIDPNCIVNSRVGNGLGDYAVEEQRIPEDGNPEPWETCMTTNGHWAYYTGDDNWKSTQTLVHHMVDIASKGGNFLLNVGPTDLGEIPAPAMERLRKVGQWLKINGESVYGTTAGPLQSLSWGRCTRKVTDQGDVLYLHVFDWPADCRLMVGGLDPLFNHARLLAGQTPLQLEHSDNITTILLSSQAPDAMDTVVVLTKVNIPHTRLLDGQVLAAVKSRLQQEAEELQPAWRTLQDRADAALQQRPVSVMDKNAVPSSGDKHDYMSMGPYWWPNPDTPNGLPYVRRDGYSNPERKQFDSTALSTLTDSVRVLSLAYYFSNKVAYAKHAAVMIRTWFLDEATRMNPNLTFGQHIPGIPEGRGIGLIETRRLVDIGEAVALLSESETWQKQDDQAMRQWYSDFLTWMLESKNGRDEAAAKNNHGSRYDVQVAYFALFTGRDAIASEVLGQFAQKRLATHIEPDGRQPHELTRTKSFGYGVFNLEALFAGATLAQGLGIDLWHWSDQGRGSLRSALEFLIPYVFADEEWPYTQIVDREEYTDRVARLLQQAALHYPEAGYDQWIRARYVINRDASLAPLLYGPVR